MRLARTCTGTWRLPSTRRRRADRCEILGPHLDHGLDVGHDLGELAVVEHQEIVGAQARRRRKIELDTCALAAEHKTLLLAPIVEFQQQRVDDLASGALSDALSGA